MEIETRATTGRPYVGTSGWAYREWRGKFYPKGLAQAKELAYTADRVATIEMNSPFYRLQAPTTYRKWAGQAPEGFVYAVKGWRAVTHFKKLVGAEEAVAEFYGSGPLELGAALGPILWQLPPKLVFSAEVLSDFLAALPRTHAEAAELAGTDCDFESAGLPLQYAVEPRNESFGHSEAEAVLRECGAALVWADSAGRHPAFDAVTANFIYVRLHGSPRIYYSNYSDEALQDWAGRLRPELAAGRDCYVYFDNTARSYAPYNAEALAEILQR